MSAMEIVNLGVNLTGTIEISRIGASFGIGCLICNMVICVPVSYFGIKKCMYFVPLPNIVNITLPWLNELPN